MARRAKTAKLPSSTRKLTVDEIKRLNKSRVAHGLKPLGLHSKTRVDLSLKRITWRSKTISDRQFAERKLGGQSREQHSIELKTQRTKLLHNPHYETSLKFGPLSKRQLFSVCKRFPKGTPATLYGISTRSNRYGVDSKGRWETIAMTHTNDIRDHLDELCEDIGMSVNDFMAFAIVVYTDRKK
jgi:hypothetical protein